MQVIRDGIDYRKMHYEAARARVIDAFPNPVPDMVIMDDKGHYWRYELNYGLTGGGYAARGYKWYRLTWIGVLMYKMKIF